MIYDLNDLTPTKLTAEEILLLISQEELFLKYFGNFELGKMYLSPFRKENLPSFNIYLNKNKELCYKDFGHSQGNIFSFIKNLYGITEMSEVYSLIYKDFNLGSKKYVSNKAFQERILSSSSKIPLIFKDILPFDLNDLSYFSRAGITLSDLQTYNVYKVRFILKGDDIIWYHTDKDPIFVYYFPLSRNFKAYRPFRKKRKNKFLSTANNFDIQGYEQLPETNSLVFMTKSMKDVLTFKSAGFSAFAPQGEDVYLPEEIIEDLNSRFERIIIYYDNDIPGIRASKKMSELLGYENLYIPKDSFETKDPFDYASLYSIQNFKKLINLQTQCL